LNHEHPAFGAALENPKKMIVISSNSSVDIQRLEQHFGASMERNINRLPKESVVAKIPWASDSWAAVKDGINQRWNGGPSASEKYARAFGLDVLEFTEAISRSSGIRSQEDHNEVCFSDEQCQQLLDGSKCGIRKTDRSGYCIPTWYGLSHAWAPAAILEPEPRCPVVKNGVRFEVRDIKALMTQVYDGANIPSVFTGARYDGPTNGARDQYGRYVDASRRDLGAGFFHIALTNIMGRYKRSFVVDIDAGNEVWNQPTRSYKVLSMESMTPEKAGLKFYGKATYPFNRAAAKIVHTRTSFSWIAEGLDNRALVANGGVNQYTQSMEATYLLELDANNNIIGGEWIGKSNTNHPDFLWFPVSTPSLNTVTKVGLSYRLVKNLLTASVNGDC
jgi:hypothetical protein